MRDGRNGSLCRRKRAPWFDASDRTLRILPGEDDLALYRFGTMTAKYFACRHCSVSMFTRPRRDPGRWAFNLRCIDGLDLSALPVLAFDGENSVGDLGDALHRDAGVPRAVSFMVAFEGDDRASLLFPAVTDVSALALGQRLSADTAVDVMRALLKKRTAPAANPQVDRLIATHIVD